jgi:hypothetical protein
MSHFTFFDARRRLPFRPAPAWRSGAFALLALALLGATPAARADSTGGLSQRAITAVLDGIAADTRRRELTTLEAVLTPDAEIAVQTSATGSLQTLRHSKSEYLAIARKVFASLEAENIRYTYEDQPPSIRLAPDRRTAIVVGTSSETFAFPEGRSMTTTTRSTLHFVWQDGRARVERVQAIDQTPPPTMR